MKIIDISWPITTASTQYKDNKHIDVQEVKHFDVDGVRESKICLSSHSGTHVDAPSHFLRDGKTIDHVALKDLMGTCQVLDLTDCTQKISGQDLENKVIEKDQIVLLKTTNSLLNPTEPFSPHFIYLDASGAEYLVDKKVKAVGIDYLGIERAQPTHSTHQALMKADIAIIEGLRLGHVQSGAYHLICLPIYIVGVEAAPARAVLLEKG